MEAQCGLSPIAPVQYPLGVKSKSLLFAVGLLAITSAALVGCAPESSASKDPYLGLEVVHHLSEEHGIVVAYQLPADILLTKKDGGVIAELTEKGRSRLSPEAVEFVVANWPAGQLDPAGLTQAIEAYDGAMHAH